MIMKKLFSIILTIGLSTMALGQSTSIKIWDGTNTCSVRDIGGTDALNVAFTDSSGGHAGVSGNPIYTATDGALEITSASAISDILEDVNDLVFQLFTTPKYNPSQQIHVDKNYTATQTGTNIWTPGSGNRIAIQSMEIDSYGTTGARVIIWCGASGDSTFTQDTDHKISSPSFVPSATVKPGLIKVFETPIYCETDEILKITTDAGISLDIIVDGYEFND